MIQKMVLLAEADVQWQEICQRRLVASGFTVTTAIDGLTCLMRLETHWPAVLVVDVDMLRGGADGILSWVREQSARRPQPVLIVTGRTAPETLSVQTGVAPSHCLQKPFPLELLVDLCTGRLAAGAAQMPDPLLSQTCDESRGPATSPSSGVSAVGPEAEVALEALLPIIAGAGDGG